MKKKIIWGIILLAIVGSGVFYFVKPKKIENKYVTTEAKIQNIKQTVSVTGKIKPVDKANLAFEINGTINNIFVNIGDKVEKGQLVAMIDDTVMQSQLSEALITLNSREENLKLKRRKWNDYKPEEKEVAKLSVDEARAGIQTIRNQLKKYVLTSPIDGFVIKKNFDKDETAQAMMPVVTIMKGDAIEITANISEADIVKIKLGQKAMITFDAFPSDKIFEAEVIKIDPAATVIQDVVYYATTFSILKNENNQDLTELSQKMRVGMSVDLDILTAEKNNVLAIPIQAVKEINGEKYVEILTKKDINEKVEKVKVKTGLFGDDGLVEIISGLKNGDEIITFVKKK